MQARLLGDITIDRIVELEAPIFHPLEFFDEAVAEAVEPHRQWLEPEALDPASGKFIMPVQSYLLRSRHHTILIDTCIGCRKSYDGVPEWRDLRDETWLRNLEAAGVGPDDIDYVFCTHLHVDHVGWNSMKDGGQWVSTFPNARYLVVQREYEYWSADTSEDQVPVMQDSVTPIFDSGLADLVEADHIVSPHIRLFPTPGHTPGHVSVMIESEGETAMITGDTMHHPCQIARPDWSVTFDEDPPAAASCRKTILEDLADSSVLVIGTHFASPTAGKIIRDGDTYKVTTHPIKV